MHEFVSAKHLMPNIILGQINSEEFFEYWKKVIPSNINELFYPFSKKL